MSDQVEPMVPLPAPAKKQSAAAIGLLITINAIVVAVALINAPAETLAASVSVAVMASALMRRRYHAILVQANRVCRAFVFSEGLLADEIRELSKTVILWEGK
jgi:hypothetical protein